MGSEMCIRDRCEGVGYGERFIGQGFAPIVWDLVCIVEVGECGACEKVCRRNCLVDGGMRLNMSVSEASVSYSEAS